MILKLHFKVLLLLNQTGHQKQMRHFLKSATGILCCCCFFILLFCFKSRSTAYNFQGPQLSPWKARTCCDSKSMLAQQTAPGSIQKEKGRCRLVSMTSDNRSQDFTQGQERFHHRAKKKKKKNICLLSPSIFKLIYN